MSTKHILAIEIGGTKLQASLGLSDGTVLETVRGTVEVDEGAQGILQWFEESIPSLLEQSTSPPEAIGVGFGGPVDSATGEVLVSHQIQGWEGIQLKSWFEEKFGLPTLVANDSNAAGWAEYCLGAGKGTDNFVYMNIGSGIGGALIINGQLYNGQGRGAGENGHTYVPDWTVETPGAYDKLENICSGWSIEQRIRGWSSLEEDTALYAMTQGEPANLTCAMLGKAAMQGDAVAIAELDQVAESIAVALCNVLALLHPEKIAVGGGVALLGEPLFTPLQRHVDDLVFGLYKGHFEIVPCELNEAVVIAGALLLAGQELS